MSEDLLQRAMDLLHYLGTCRMCACCHEQDWVWVGHTKDCRLDALLREWRELRAASGIEQPSRFEQALRAFEQGLRAWEVRDDA